MSIILKSLAYVLIPIIYKKMMVEDYIIMGLFNNMEIYPLNYYFLENIF